MKRLVMVSVCVFSSLLCVAQQEGCNQNRLRRKVLAELNVDKPFVFNCGQYERVELVYLGVVGSKSKGYKIMRSFWVHGESRRGTSRILIFNEQDELLGNYYVTTNEDLQTKVESRELVFLNSAKADCDTPVVSRVNFAEGIPEQIFIRCKGDTGDFYSFSQLE